MHQAATLTPSLEPNQNEHATGSAAPPQAAEQFSASPWLVERWLTICAAAVGLVLLVLLARPLLIRQIGVEMDLGAFHLPLRAFYARCLKRGDSFDWLPSMHCGVFITGEGEHGPYHPLHLLLYRFLPLDIAFATETYLSFPLMFAGMYLFLRRVAGRPGALLGALVYTFATNNIGHGHHLNYVAVLAHLPWQLWLLDWLAESDGWRRWRTAAAIGLVTGSQLLLGSPQALSYSLLAETLYALFFLPRAARPWSAALVWCAGKILGGAVGSVQLLATYTFLAHSNRATFDPLFGSYIPSRLIQVVAPDLQSQHVLIWWHEPLYFGAVPFLLFLGWLMTCRRGMPAARPALYAIVLGGLAVWLATGYYGGLYLLQTHLPLVGQFRVPARYVNLVAFAGAILAAVSFRHLTELLRQGRVLPWRALALPWLAAAVAVAAGLAFQLAFPPANRQGFDTRFLPGMLFMVAAAAMLTAAARGRTVAVALLLVLAGCDAYYYGLKNVHFGKYLWRRSVRLEQWQAEAPRPPARNEGRLQAFDESLTRLLLDEACLVDGYHGGLEPRKRLDYERADALRLAGVHFCHGCESTSKKPIPGLQPAGSGWYRLTDPLPRVRLVGRALASDDPARHLSAIDLRTTALTPQPVDLDEDKPGTAVLHEERPGRLAIETNADGRQLLVVSESYDPGWQAAVDGAPAELLPAYGDFLACVVGPGRHTVQLTFRPPALVAGKWLSLGGTAACLLLMALSVTATLGVAHQGVGGKKKMPVINVPLHSTAKQAANDR
jgi:hypothetical protein